MQLLAHRIRKLLTRLALAANEYQAGEKRFKELPQEYLVGVLAKFPQLDQVFLRFGLALSDPADSLYLGNYFLKLGVNLITIKLANHINEFASKRLGYELALVDDIP